MRKGLLDENPIIKSTNSYGSDYLVNMILNNFQGNPRKIKHFIRTLAFQLEAINEKINSIPEGAEKDNLVKVKNSPELLAKTLIIQDRFPDFYEQLISEPKLLQKHEEGDIAEDKDLQNLIAQEPRFFNSATRVDGLKTIDPYYFLYFSGSTGYVEAKVVDPSEVRALARSGDFNGLTKIISGLTDEPRNLQVEFIKKEFDAAGIQPPEKINIVKSLLHASSLIEEPVIRLQKLKDVLDEKTKYNTELASLQSVDFDKFISFVGIETINRLFSETPFTEVNIQIQLLEAFISKQTEIPKGEITDRFIQAITEGIQRNDTNTPSYLGIFKKMTPDNIASSDALQRALVETYKKSTAPLKQDIFDILVSMNLSVAVKDLFENTILLILEKDPIAEVVTILGNIPTKISKAKFDIGKVVSMVNKRIESASRADAEQLINAITQPTVISEIGSKNTESLLKNLVEMIGSPDADKKSYILSKLPDFVSMSANHSEILKRIAQIIGGSSSGDVPQIISAVLGMSDFWSHHPKIKNQFADELKSIAKGVKDKEVKDLLLKAVDDLIPPEPEEEDVSDKEEQESPKDEKPL